MFNYEAAMEDEVKGNAAVLGALDLELRRFGIREFCVAAGARNAPVLAMLLELGPDIGYEIRHFFDERSAAFFALGRAMMGRQPVAVVTTSGTAAGELLPAMMEAYYQGLHLVAITADRPSHYERSGAPQAVEQPGIFGVYAAARWEGKWLTNEEGREVNLGEAMAQHHALQCEPRGGCELTSVPYVVSLMAQDLRRRWRRKERGTDSYLEGKQGETFWETQGCLAVLVGGLRTAEEVSQTRELLLELRAPVVAEATANLFDEGELEGLMVSGGEKALQALDPRASAAHWFGAFLALVA